MRLRLQQELRSRGLVVCLLSVVLCAYGQTGRDLPTTAWKDGSFHMDRAGVVERSDIVFGQPNLKANQAAPLGNGRLGVALWSEDGLTAQLNRVDTLPGRLSPGQVSIPGLAALTAAAD